MTYKLEEKVVCLLKNSGWQDNRKINIDKYKAAWKSEMYILSPAAAKFTECFGGIKVVHGAYVTEGGSDESIFDPGIALNTIFHERVHDDYEQRTGTSLCPIGVGFSEHLVYLIDSSEGFYGGFDDYFCFIGKNVGEALSNIFFNHNFTSL